jgi:hypothetical protein
MLKKFQQFIRENKSEDFLDIIDYITTFADGQVPEKYTMDYINGSIIFFLYGSKLEISQISKIDKQIEYLGYQVIHHFHLKSGQFIQIGKLGKYQDIHDLPLNIENTITKQKRMEIGDMWISFLYKNQWISVEEIYSDEMEEPVRFYPDDELSGLSLEDWQRVYLMDFQSIANGWNKL